jgi:hypothetical protein
MKVTYINDILSIDISRVFLDLESHRSSSDIIVISGNPVVRATCFQVPLLPGIKTRVIVEDDLGRTKSFEEGMPAILRKLSSGPTYELVEVVDYDTVSEELGQVLIVDRLVQSHHRVLEIGGDDAGTVPAALLAKSKMLLCFRSDQEKATKLREVLQASCPAVEGAILSSVSLVKNVNMLKEPAPGIDDDETWKPVRTMDLAELAQAHPGFDRPNVLILGCNYDKYCPLILEHPMNDIILCNADLKVIIIKNDFLPPNNDLHRMRNILREHDFEITLTVGASDATSFASYMPNMYEAWERKTAALETPLS